MELKLGKINSLSWWKRDPLGGGCGKEREGYFTCYEIKENYWDPKRALTEEDRKISKSSNSQYS